MSVSFTNNPELLSIMDVVEDTTVDGPGFRTSIYAAGCLHHCEGCHNSETWEFSHGTLLSVEDLLSRVVADPFAHVTFSGGDPMFQAEGFTRLAQRIKEVSDKSIWCYTGYTFEQVLQLEAPSQLLRHIDVLVDGRYVAALRDEGLRFRGSCNQRLIDVQGSLREGSVVLWG